MLRTAGVAERCAVVGSDFFTSVPPGGDAYVLAQVIHDRPEEELTILHACHRVMAPGARPWLIEQVIQPGDDPVELTLLDLNMLMLFAAQERTAEEYQKLLEASGFGEIKLLPTDTGWRVVEAVRR